ncbi:Hsp70 family protein [Desulfobacterales bacterium HSG16]|nr:Hsp70 family protein [Desulfobacterales bacterium HSG16]
MNLPDNKRYIIGIDLGTTNSAVSYVDLESEDDKGRIKIFAVPQLTGPGEFSTLSVLPSFLYIPGEYDIKKKEAAVPWKTEDDNFCGAFARDHGAKVPARLVSSAKSWLCHSNVDRKAKILPWGSGEDVYKVSPVQATANYLRHVRRAWNSTMGDDDDLYLENQSVIITVPASFDEVARDLTVEAAAIAGIASVTLLEEPLAAFYNWLMRHEKKWSDHVEPGELILVCDVGGGTTDFTLITLREVDGSPRFERIAVGDHLILGGDNIDLALARRVEVGLSKKKGGQKKISLSSDRWKALCHQCRQAKEIILNNEADTAKITLMGKGKKLIANTLSAKLTRDDVEKSVLEGFFPLADSGEKKKSGSSKKGITEFGLPYEQEPSITKHLGWFLEQHKEDIRHFLKRESHAPDLILFNGGSLKSDVIQERVRQAIRHWFDQEDTSLPRILTNPDPDLSVALGASYYGLVKVGQGVRVGSGSARAYYLGVATQDEAGRDKNAICLVERGLDEGSQIELADRQFEVLANQAVNFDLFSSSFRSGDHCGDLVTIDDSLTALPPIQTVIQYGKKGEKTDIPVTIEAAYTEIGTLAIWCKSGVSNHRWQLQFQLRDMIAAKKATEVADTEVFDESVTNEILNNVNAAFEGKLDPRMIDGLPKQIAKIIDRPKNKWPMSVIRAIADRMIENISARNAKNTVECRWLNLTGFCMRPGFGDGMDEQRIRQLWKIYKTGPIHANNPQVRSEWWIMWRRITGGLQAGQQRQFIQDLSSVMIPKKGKIKIPPQQQVEIWMTIANMERLLTKDKVKWGRQLLAEMMEKNPKPQHFWALSRIGARELLYGPADRVIPPKEAVVWIKKIVSKKWQDPKPVVSALGQLARKTGDRIRDIDETTAQKAIDWMSEFDFAESHIRHIKEVTAIEIQEQTVIFGDSLPSGLVLKE